MHRPDDRHYPFPIRDEIVSRHPCPACNSMVIRRYQPGRGRVYCANACRQRAYRHRRQAGIRLLVRPGGPPSQRTMTFDRRHAERDPRDPASKLIDHRERVVSVCGVFSRPTRLGAFEHHDFLPDHPWSCRSCVALTGQSPDDMVG